MVKDNKLIPRFMKNEWVEQLKTEINYYFFPINEKT